MSLPNLLLSCAQPFGFFSAQDFCDCFCSRNSNTDGPCFEGVLWIIGLGGGNAWSGELPGWRNSQRRVDLKHPHLTHRGLWHGGYPYALWQHASGTARHGSGSCFRRSSHRWIAAPEICAGPRCCRCLNFVANRSLAERLLLCRASLSKRLAARGCPFAQSSMDFSHRETGSLVERLLRFTLAPPQSWSSSPYSSLSAPLRLSITSYCKAIALLVNILHIYMYIKYVIRRDERSVSTCSGDYPLDRAAHTGLLRTRAFHIAENRVES